MPAPDALELTTATQAAIRIIARDDRVCVDLQRGARLVVVKLRPVQAGDLAQALARLAAWLNDPERGCIGPDGVVLATPTGTCVSACAGDRPPRRELRFAIGHRRTPALGTSLRVGEALELAVGLFDHAAQVRLCSQAVVV